MKTEAKFFALTNAQTIIDLENRIETLKEQLRAQGSLLTALEQENMILRNQLEGLKHGRSEKDYED